MARSLQKGAPSKHRLVIQPKPGISKKSKAPYWRGERCETIVATRVAGYPVRSSRAGARGPGKPRSADQQLRRLERNLARRKTLEARQRIQRQIKELKSKLENERWHKASIEMRKKHHA